MVLRCVKKEQQQNGKYNFFPGLLLNLEKIIGILLTENVTRAKT